MTEQEPKIIGLSKDEKIELSPKIKGFFKKIKPTRQKKYFMALMVFFLLLGLALLSHGNFFDKCVYSTYECQYKTKCLIQHKNTTFTLNAGDKLVILDSPCSTIGAIQNLLLLLGMISLGISMGLVGGIIIQK